MKLKKQNGFPTRYAYACGYGIEFGIDNNYIRLYENDSHTCYDVTGFIGGERIWDQFFHVDGESTKLAERCFNQYKAIIRGKK